ncbi:glycoside hydrolase family 18 protein [Aspergillus undulatus]|uniref:glycoside hydrolase family 18 protein n=1 Tax=Aspergillus undulatus TaxID=1810928 RepID=UPI003CCD743B
MRPHGHSSQQSTKSEPSSRQEQQSWLRLADGAIRRGSRMRRERRRLGGFLRRMLGLCLRIRGLMVCIYPLFALGNAIRDGCLILSGCVLSLTSAGVDIDWEYPGGNGDDYKRIPNSEKTWEIQAYPHLLTSIRTAIGPDKLISAAVPGLERDMLAFNAETIPLINPSLDFYNIMTYDLMNRRDNVTKHHTGVALSLDAINAYIGHGVPAGKANLGFAFYVKWFRTDPDANAECVTNPLGLGCKTVLMEDPNTGADLGQAGAFSWHDPVPADLSQSFEKALVAGAYDDQRGGYFFFDEREHIFWSFDTADAIERKVPAIVGAKELGGVFAWGLGEDAPDFAHLRALTRAYSVLDLSTRSDHDHWEMGATCKPWAKEEL